MTLLINRDKTHNHYDISSGEMFDILRESVIVLNSMYERLRDSDDFDDDECNRVYNIIDILWDMELLS